MRGSASRRVDEVIDDKNKQNQLLGQKSCEPSFSENRLFLVLRNCSFSFSELPLYSWLTSVNCLEAAEAGPAVRDPIGMIFSDLIVYWFSIFFLGLVIFSYCQIRQPSEPSRKYHTIVPSRKQGQRDGPNPPSTSFVHPGLSGGVGDCPSVRSGSSRFWGMSCPDVTSVDRVDMCQVFENS